MSRFVARLPDGDLDGRHAHRYAFVLWDALSVAASARRPFCRSSHISSSARGEPFPEVLRGIREWVYAET